jgi:hypothetical protein
MARNSWRGSVAAAIAAAAVILVWATAPLSAHRRDEYLQAARVAIDPGHIEVQLDLTPGIALAPAVLSDIDRDGDGSFSPDEMSAYAARVLSEVRLEVDGRPTQLLLKERHFPSREAVLGGEGTIQLRLAASMPAMPDGAHRVVFRNDHRPEMGVYLANALVPAEPRVSIVSQRRDALQRGLTIDYTVGEVTRFGVPWWLMAGVVIGIAMVGDAIVRRRRR